MALARGEDEDEEDEDNNIEVEDQDFRDHYQKTSRDHHQDACPREDIPNQGQVVEEGEEPQDGFGGKIKPARKSYSTLAKPKKMNSMENLLIENVQGRYK